ncbi:MAG: methylaspartate mutase subunit S [Chloroflexi bacterium]|nr:methylaspartate mutase subunit S [Chloroflexota bacterium]
MVIPSRPLILGVIGTDIHMVGSRVLERVLREAGFNVVHLGGAVPSDEFIKAAMETDACAILISSLSGYGEFYAQDFRKMCDEAGLKDIKLYMGGHVVMGEEIEWEEVEAKFKMFGFNGVTRPGISTDEVIKMLNADLCDANQ